MRIPTIILLLALISCGKEQGSDELKKQFLKIANFTAQCTSVETNLTKRSIDGCNNQIDFNGKTYLFGLTQEEMHHSFDTNVNPTIRVFLTEGTPEQILFHLVSKNGKVISNAARVFNNSLFFEEKTKGDFLSNEIHIAAVGAPVGTKKCSGGVYGIDAPDNLNGILKECPNLRAYPKLKIVATAPIHRVKSDKITIKNRSAKPTYSTFRYHYRTYIGQKEQEFELSKMFKFNIDIDRSIRIEQVTDQLCYFERIVDIYLNRAERRNRIPDKSIKSMGFGKFKVNGKWVNVRDNYRKRRCYKVKPNLIGHIIIKE